MGADYADIQEAQSGRREQEAPVEATASDQSIEFAYRHETLSFRTSIEHDGRWRVANGRAVTHLTLPPRHTESIALRIVPHHTSDEISDSSADDRTAIHQRWRQSLTQVEAPANRLFERVLARNVRDIASFPLLDGRQDEWLAMQAGMPLQLVDRMFEPDLFSGWGIRTLSSNHAFYNPITAERSGRSSRRRSCSACAGLASMRRR